MSKTKTLGTTELERKCGGGGGARERHDDSDDDGDDAAHVRIHKPGSPKPKIVRWPRRQTGIRFWQTEIPKLRRASYLNLYSGDPSLGEIPG